ncbi:MAG TPA: hypothetical protein VNL69_12230 [Bacteroidota bacterium]|nr:hypothetical protein [Bacteroidota bacterium]
MAAVDAFHRFLSTLSPEDRAQLDGLIREWREELLAARSEEARLRIVQEFIAEARERMKKKKSFATLKT